MMHRRPTGPLVLSMAMLALVLTPNDGMARKPREPSQSFHDAVAEAWARLPARQEFAARQATVTARLAAGGAFFPNAPSLNGTYVNDRVLGSNNGYYTNQIELSTPVWLPGERRATQETATATGTAIGAASEAAHLELAATVLDLATQATLAADFRNVAARRLAAARALATDLSRRNRVGESSESDALAADADAAGAAMTLSGAEAQLGSARAGLAAITGNDLLPRLDASPPRPEADAPASHPRITAAERAVAVARADRNLVGITNRDDPEIGVQAINEKQPGTRWDNRVGVIFRLPFATEARNAPRRAAAEQAVTVAEVQLAVARRDVQAGIRQAAAMLAGADQGAGAAERAANALEKRRGQIDRAWRLGEMSLIEVVRANALAFDAAFSRDRARTERSAARLRLRLAEGMLP